MNAVTYIAEAIAEPTETHNVHICLAQMLPSFPPELFEIEEREPDQQKWMNAAIEAAKYSSLKHAIDRLLAAGIPPECIETQFFQAEPNGEGTVQAILELVDQLQCDAVVIGQAEHSHFHIPFGYNLIKNLSYAMSSKGVNIWVVFSETRKTKPDFLRAAAENSLTRRPLAFARR